MRALPLLLSLFILCGPLCGAAGATPARVLQDRISYEQKIGSDVPADLAFTDADGERVKLRDLLGKPTLLLFAWYNCENICGVSMRTLAERAASLSFALGKDYDIVTLSIDPSETREDAAATRRTMLAIAGKEGTGGWRFLTGTKTNIDALAEAAGFHYVRDDETAQYLHPVGIVALTPAGRISSYLFGLEFPVSDLRLALVDASEGELGSIVDQVVLRCHRFDPATGRYSLAVVNLLRAAGGLTVAVLFGLVGFWWWRDRRAARRQGGI